MSTAKTPRMWIDEPLPVLGDSWVRQRFLAGQRAGKSEGVIEDMRAVLAAVDVGAIPSFSHYYAGGPNERLLMLLAGIPDEHIIVTRPIPLPAGHTGTLTVTWSAPVKYLRPEHKPGHYRKHNR